MRLHSVYSLNLSNFAFWPQAAKHQIRIVKLDSHHPKALFAPSDFVMYRSLCYVLSFAAFFPTFLPVPKNFVPTKVCIVHSLLYCRRRRRLFMTSSVIIRVGSLRAFREIVLNPRKLNEREKSERRKGEREVHFR